MPTASESIRGCRRRRGRTALLTRIRVDCGCGIDERVVLPSARRVKPASRIRRSISSVVVRCVVLAAETTFSSIMSEPKSLQPKRSAICPIFMPIVTQLAWRFGTLSSTMRAIATVRRYSTASGLRLVRHRRRVLGLERPADERREAARPRLHLAHALEMLDAARPASRRCRTSW